MRNAASVLGIIGGIMAMIAGFIAYGYTVGVEQLGEIEGIARQVDNVSLTRVVSFAAPLLAIAGGAMARFRALWGGILLLLASAMMLYGFGFGFGTMFPIGMTGLAGLMAVAARRPDVEEAH